MANFTPAQLARLKPLFATPEQGVKADEAAPADTPLSAFPNDANFVVSGSLISQFTNDALYLAQGANISLLANNLGYLKPLDNVSALTNDANYVPAFNVITHEETVTGLTVTLAHVPKSWYQPQVFVNGALQPSTAYTIVGTLVTSTVPLVAAIVQIIYAY